MLRELSHVRQALEEPRRRWFADDFFDLIVWLGYRMDQQVAWFVLGKIAAIQPEHEPR
jgi:hypothetical protein